MKIERAWSADHSDERGEIYDLVERDDLRRVALFTTEKGAARGGHYHRHARMYVYLVSGSVCVMSRRVNDSIVISDTAHSGDLIVIDPYDVHQLTAQEDTTWVVMICSPDTDITHGRQYENDTVREAV